MKKIKFKTEYIPLSDERIERHKDFDKLLNAYIAHPRPDWKSRLLGNKWLLYTAGIVTGVALTSLVWWNINQLNENHHLAKNENSDSLYRHSIEHRENVPSNISPAEEKESNDSGLKVMFNDKNTLVQSVKEAHKEEPQDHDTNTHVFMNSQHSDTWNAPSSNSISAQRKKTAPSHSDHATDTVTVIQKSVSEKNAQAADVKRKSDTNQTADVDQIVQEKSESEIHLGEETPSEARTDQDTLIVKNQTTDASTDTPVSSLPADTSKKGVHLSLPKIDLNDEWSASKEAITKVADSVGRKTGSLFSRLFEKDSAEEKGSPNASESKTDHSNEDIAVKDSFVHHYAQITFVSPLGTEGAGSQKYVHNLSLNVLQGYNGALAGVEFGGLANIEKGYVTGVQFAGLTNFTLGNVKGAQFGGLLNCSRNLDGAQFGGLANTATGKMFGLQAAGTVNFAGDTFRGLQLGGVLNLSTANKHAIGWQVAGVGNVCLGDLKGGQVSGVVNVSHSLTGTQVGLINFSKNISGFQLGLINIADSLNGDALGLISISRNGNHHLDFFSSEILYGNVGIKLGSPHVYNIFAAGAAPLKDTVRIGFGLGLGGHFNIHRLFIDLDGVSWTIHNKTLRDWNGINLWNQIRLMAGYEITHRFAIYAGPTANAHVFKNIYPSIAPYTIYDHSGDINVQGWIGFTAGLQFF